MGCCVTELVMLLEWWSGTECTIYTDPHAYPLYGKESAIVVLNHKFEIDFLCGWSLAERFGILAVSRTRSPLPFLQPQLLFHTDASHFPSPPLLHLTVKNFLGSSSRGCTERSWFWVGIEVEAFS